MRMLFFETVLIFRDKSNFSMTLKTTAHFKILDITGLAFSQWVEFFSAEAIHRSSFWSLIYCIFSIHFNHQQMMIFRFSKHSSIILLS